MRGIEKTKKKKLNAINTVTEIVSAFTLGPNLFDAAHFMTLTELNCCPKCKMYISEVLKDDSMMMQKCPYCGAVIADNN